MTPKAIAKPNETLAYAALSETAQLLKLVMAERESSKEAGVKRFMTALSVMGVLMAVTAAASDDKKPLTPAEWNKEKIVKPAEERKRGQDAAEKEMDKQNKQTTPPPKKK